MTASSSLQPGDLCVVIDAPDYKAFRQNIGKTVVLIEVARVCHDGTCADQGWSRWCPHWHVSGLPPEQYPSHEILRKIPPAPMVEEQVNQKETQDA